MAKTLGEGVCQQLYINVAVYMLLNNMPKQNNEVCPYKTNSISRVCIDSGYTVWIIFGKGGAKGKCMSWR